MNRRPNFKESRFLVGTFYSSTRTAVMNSTAAARAAPDMTEEAVGGNGRTVVIPFLSMRTAMSALSSD